MLLSLRMQLLRSVMKACMLRMKSMDRYCTHYFDHQGAAEPVACGTGMKITNIHNIDHIKCIIMTVFTNDI